MQHAITALVLAFMAILLVWELNALNSRLDDLEARVTTFETIRIEAAIPPQDGG